MTRRQTKPGSSHTLTGMWSSPVRQSTGRVDSQRTTSGKSFSERVTAVQIGRLRLIATYQPLWSKGPEEIEKFRKDLENELA